MGQTWEQFMEFSELLTKKLNLFITEEDNIISGRSLVTYIHSIRYEFQFMRYFLGELVNPLIKHKVISVEEKIEEINKTAQKFHKDVSSKKLHSPKIMDLIFYNVWRAMALSEDPLEADAKYWESTGLVNYDFAPNVKLGILKKAFAKIMFFILKKVMK